MNALSSIFPGDDANPSENPFEQDFKKASLKADNEDKETTKLTLPGPEVIHSSDAVVEEEQELEEQEQNEQPSGDNVIEEIQTSFDHEETIENVGNEETIGDEDLNDKNSFRVSYISSRCLFKQFKGAGHTPTKWYGQSGRHTSGHNQQ